MLSWPIVTPHPVAVNRNKDFPIHVFIFPVSERNETLFNSKSNLDVIITVERISTGWLGREPRKVSSHKQRKQQDGTQQLHALAKRVTPSLREGLSLWDIKKRLLHIGYWSMPLISYSPRRPVSKWEEIISIWCLSWEDRQERHRTVGISLNFCVSAKETGVHNFFWGRRLRCFAPLTSTILAVVDLK